MKCVRQQANLIFFFKQKTAYELRISDWSSDVCSSDLAVRITRRTRSARAESKHWKIALCSESAGSSVAPWRTAASITSAPAETSGRTEERRVGKEGVSTCKSRGSPYQ